MPEDNHTMQILGLVLLLSVASVCAAERNLTFPRDFLFGAATAAYQVEGAWNTSGKGENIWDRLAHAHPECFYEHETADVTTDSYHKYKEDVKALKEVGFDMYRFSISWARILPKGIVYEINQDGIDYYNNLINLLLANKIQPVVTMYHFDLPQYLQDLGGLASPNFVDWFEDYARILYTHFGDRVKWWITFNEPLTMMQGYETACAAPGVLSSGVGEYLAMHNMLKAHARAYHLYHDNFNSSQQGKVGITLSTIWAEPRSQSEADVNAAEAFFTFTVGWFANPIFSKEGDYPALMKERIANISKAQGFYRSRLPEFSKYWIDYIKGTHDFFGLNQYSSFVVYATNATSNSGMDLSNDAGGMNIEASWPQGYPAGLRKMLKKVSDTYNNVDILITVNGWSDSGGLNDTVRIHYLVNHLAAALDAVNIDKVSLKGYTVWSLIDNFEWTSGFSAKFGLYSVDFNDPERPRVAKSSSKVFASIIKNRKLPEGYLDTDSS